MLEHEKKVMLTENEYSTLLTSVCKYAISTDQTNYYFDTDSYDMNQKGVTCRIRSKNGEAEATVKSHANRANSCSTEKTIPLKNHAEFSIFESMGLKLQGSLKTQRTVAYEDEFCEVVLDKNTYLDFTDYELEIEYLPRYESCAMHVLRNFARVLYLNNCITDIDAFCDRTKTCKSKSQRFFERRDRF